MAPNTAIAATLGGPKVLGRKVSSLTDFDELISDGLPWASAARVKKLLDVSDSVFSALLGVSLSTVNRQKKKAGARLSALPSDRLFRLARVISAAREVFKTPDAVRSWLSRPQLGLGERVPLELVKTEAGAAEVQKLLGRIRDGVFS